MKKNIVILIGFIPIPRIYKRIEVEKSIGNLHLICWDRGNNMLLPPTGDGYETHIIGINAESDPIRRIIPYHRFSKKAKKLLETIKPRIIHVQGLDMLKIAVSYKKRASNKVSIIYEVADLHRLIIDQQKNLFKRCIRNYLRDEDKRLEPYYELLLITSERFREAYFNSFVSDEKILYMPNIPHLTAFEKFNKKKDSSRFVVGYIGSIRYKEQIKNLIEASKRCRINLLIAGYEEGDDEIEQLCKNEPHIEWIGRFDFEEQAAYLYGKCDVIYSVYNADLNNVRVALPNKLYESVYCEMPLIVAKNTYLAQIVKEWGVGLSVSHTDVVELCDVINKLCNDKELYNQIVNNCKNKKDEIDLEKYNNVLKTKILTIMGLVHD